MRELSYDDFSESVGSAYGVKAGEQQLELTLAKAAQLGPSARAAGSFRLEFLGPAEPMLEQAIYSFTQGEDEFEIFIVPVARDESGTSYEAIFN